MVFFFRGMLMFMSDQRRNPCCILYNSKIRENRKKRKVFPKSGNLTEGENQERLVFLCQGKRNRNNLDTTLFDNNGPYLVGCARAVQAASYSERFVQLIAFKIGYSSYDDTLPYPVFYPQQYSGLLRMAETLYIIVTSFRHVFPSIL